MENREHYTHIPRAILSLGMHELASAGVAGVLELKEVSYCELLPSHRITEGVSRLEGIQGSIIDVVWLG